MLKRLAAAASAGFTALFLTSCGSVSGLATADNGTPVAGSYDHLVVQPFRDATAPDGFSTWTADEQKEHRANVAHCGRKIADRTIAAARERGKFETVGAEPRKGRTLLVTGEITDYNDGIASLRLWVGMGAGSSSLEGLAHVTDATTGRKVGTITIDKNSWPLGGAIAASQTADRFAEGAAAKIASEVSKYGR